MLNIRRLRRKMQALSRRASRQSRLPWMSRAHPRKGRPTHFEALESRTLLSVSWATLNDGVLTVTGTDSADVIRYVMDSTSGTNTISLNGEVAEFASGDIDKAIINAGDGRDEVQVVGDNARRETVVARLDGTAVVTEGSRLGISPPPPDADDERLVELTGAEVQRFYGYGLDRIMMYDGAGDDRFVSFEPGSSLTAGDTGNHIYGQGFSFVETIAENGGDDLAELYDYFGATEATLSNDSVMVQPFDRPAYPLPSPYRMASQFEQGHVYGIFNPADNAAVFEASENQEHIRSFETFTDMRSEEGVYRYASGFSNIGIHGDGLNEQDLVEVYDTAGDETVIFERHNVAVNRGDSYNQLMMESENGLRREATGFKRINAYATNGGDDDMRVRLRTSSRVGVATDPAYNLRAVSTAQWTQFDNAGMSFYFSGFDSISASAAVGGPHNTLEIYDSSDDDELVSNHNDVKITGDGVERYFYDFTQHSVYAVNGGFDTGRVNDSSFEDHIRLFNQVVDITSLSYDVQPSRYRYFRGLEAVTISDTYGFASGDIADTLDVIDQNADDGDVGGQTYTPVSQTVYTVLGFGPAPDPLPSWATIDAGLRLLTIAGTAGDDQVTVEGDTSVATITRNGESFTLNMSGIDDVHVNAGAGDDRFDFVMDGGFMGARIHRDHMAFSLPTEILGGSFYYEEDGWYNVRIYDFETIVGSGNTSGYFTNSNATGIGDSLLTYFRSHPDWMTAFGEDLTIHVEQMSAYNISGRAPQAILDYFAEPDSYYLNYEVDDFEYVIYDNVNNQTGLGRHGVGFQVVNEYGLDDALAVPTLVPPIEVPTPRDVPVDWATVQDGRLQIWGTDEDDEILFTADNTNASITLNGDVFEFELANFDHYNVHAGDGDDRFEFQSLGQNFAVQAQPGFIDFSSGRNGNTGYDVLLNDVESALGYGASSGFVMMTGHFDAAHFRSHPDWVSLEWDGHVVQVNGELEHRITGKDNDDSIDFFVEPGQYTGTASGTLTTSETPAREIRFLSDATILDPDDPLAVPPLTPLLS